MNCRVNTAFFFQINVLPDAPNDINARLRLRLAHVAAPAECRASRPASPSPSNAQSYVHFIPGAESASGAAHGEQVRGRDRGATNEELSFPRRTDAIGRTIGIPDRGFYEFSNVVPSSCYGTYYQLSVPRRNRPSSYRRRIDGRGLCRSVASQAYFTRICLSIRRISF